MDSIEPAGPSPAQPHPYPPPPPPPSSIPSIPDHPNFSPYSQPGQDTLTAMQFNSARNYNETTPLLNLSNNNYNIEHIPPDLVSINAPGDNVVTSSKYNKVSGKYVEVPNYPSNRTFNSNNNGQLTASKTTINVVLLVVMFQSVGFTLVLPSMYLYLKSLNGRDAFYGWIVAIYSVGSLVGSVLFGKWSDLRTPKEAIIGGTIVAIIGNIFYVAIGFFPEKDGEWLMLTARFLVGFGSGCVAVCRAFCSETTDVRNKTSMMAAVSGSQGIGFVIGPALGSVLSKLNFTIKKAVINEFTSPGYLSAILCLFSGILVLFLMPSMSPRKGAKQSIMQSTDEPQLPVYITLFLFFSSISVFAIFETDFTLLSQRDFGWGAEKNSIYFLVAAVISTVVFALIGTPWAKRQDERKAAAFGQVILILGMLAFIVYDKPVHIEDRLSLGQLFAGGVIFSIGYPLSSTYIFGMYAKILNPRVQGAKMGYITASGSLARMLGPIWASSALAVSDALVFGGTAIFLVISLVVLFFSRKKLIPHRDYGKEIPK